MTEPTLDQESQVSLLSLWVGTRGSEALSAGRALLGQFRDKKALGRLVIDLEKAESQIAP